MKIIQTAEEYNYKLEKDREKQELEKKALEKCDVCPCCGETKDYRYYLLKNIKNKGIYSPCILKSWYGLKDNSNKSILKILFGKRKQWVVKQFICRTCGAKWESDPYEA